MDIIRKDKSMIVYNQENEHIPRNFLSESPAPEKHRRKVKQQRKSREQLQKEKELIIKRLSEKQDLLLETVK